MSLTRIPDDYTGYFDSVDKEEITLQDGTKVYKWDRAKNARFHADFMLSLNTSGISANIEDCFKVVPASGLAVARLKGEGWLDGHFANLNYQETVALPEANQVYYYVIRCMSDAENRCMYEGALMNPNLNMIPMREENIFDLVIAKIEIPAGASQVTESMITDLRLNKDYCGYSVSKFNPDSIIVTADDVRDTDTHLIPVKTRAVEQSLRGNGTYSDDMRNTRVGKYKTTYDDSTDTIRVIYEQNKNHSSNATPTAYKQLSGGAISDAPYMLSGITDNNYARATIGAGNPLSLALKMNLPLIYSYSAANVEITANVRMNSYADSGKKMEVYLLDYDTLSEMPNTRKIIDILATTPTTYTFHYSLNSLANINIIGLGIDITYISGITTTYIYGATMNITYTSIYKRIADILPSDVILYDANDNPISLIQQQSQGASYGLLLEAIEEGLS